MKNFYTLFLTSILFFCSNLKAQNTLPFEQGFTSFLPTGWKNVTGGTLASGPGTGFGLWGQGPFLNNNTSGSQSARVRMYTYNQICWLTTNDFNLSSGTTYTVSFDYAATEWYTQNPPTNSVVKDDVFAFVISLDGGITWTALQTWNSPNTMMTNTSTTFSMNLNNISGTNVRFGFYANDGYVFYPGGIDIFIDNFKVVAGSLGTSDLKVKSSAIYPNPTDGVVNISSTKKIRFLEVYNSVGQKLQSSSSTSTDLTNMKSGIYFIKTFFTDETISIHKVIRK